MKIVIFANNAHNYVKPIADGLAKNLVEMGEDICLLYDGIHWLSRLSLIKVFFSDLYRLLQNIRLKKRKFIYRFFNLLFFEMKNKRKIKEADLLIVVNNCPTVFFRNQLTRIELLRKKYNKVIVNYDLHYLPNQGWFGKIKKDCSENFGLERFDWYLPASLVTEFALPSEIPQIYNNIGFDIKSNDLHPEQDEFVALIDFPRKGYELELSVVKEALNKTKTKFIELKGLYTRDEIRSIYRKCSIYFVACRESFGLPVLETQLCGCKVYTPYADWLPAHFIDKSIFAAGVGKLGRNFEVYGNDVNVLANKIEHDKSCINHDLVIKNFKEDYPKYYSIDRNELKIFLTNVESGKINADSHLHYQRYNGMISLEDDVVLPK